MLEATTMKDKDLLLLKHLRINAREPMSCLSRKTRIPISTIFDRLKQLNGKFIRKHTCLVNFRSLGYDVKALLLFKVGSDNREMFLRFLEAHLGVNSIFRVNNGFDFLVEVVFKSFRELQDFYELTDAKGVESRQEYFVLEDLVREKFLEHQE